MDDFRTPSFVRDEVLVEKEVREHIPIMALRRRNKKILRTRMRTKILEPLVQVIGFPENIVD